LDAGFEERPFDAGVVDEAVGSPAASPGLDTRFAEQRER
jgi:hypothetical protein